MSRFEDGADTENQQERVSRVGSVCERQSVLVRSCAGQHQSSSDRLLALAVCSAQNTSPRELGTQLEGQQEGRRKSLFILLRLPGREDL